MRTVKVKKWHFNKTFLYQDDAQEHIPNINDERVNYQCFLSNVFAICSFVWYYPLKKYQLPTVNTYTNARKNVVYVIEQIVCLSINYRVRNRVSGFRVYNFHSQWISKDTRSLKTSYHERDMGEKAVNSCCCEVFLIEGVSHIGSKHLTKCTFHMTFPNLMSKVRETWLAVREHQKHDFNKKETY